MNRTMIKEKTFPYILIAPAFLILLALMVYPVIWNISISVHDVSLVSINKEWEFVGLKNYVNLLKNPYFFESLGITVKFVAGSVIFQLIVGLLVALMLNKKVKGTGLFRIFYIVAWLLSDVIVGFTWQWLYHSKFGLINHLLSFFNISGVNWLGDPKLAIWSIVITNVWFGTPFTILFLGAALKTIPTDLYEAVKVDGASKLQSFWHVTFAGLLPFISTNLILLTMWTVNLFGLQYVMTGGGPLFSTTTLSLFMYRNAFEFGDISMGSSIGFILLLINAVTAIFYVKLVKSE